MNDRRPFTAHSGQRLGARACQRSVSCSSDVWRQRVRTRQPTADRPARSARPRDSLRLRPARTDRSSSLRRHAATPARRPDFAGLRIRWSKRRQRRLRAFAAGDDDLLVRHRRHVARGEHAGQRWSAPRASTTISPCCDSSSVPFSHSVLGTRPICTNTPASSTRCVVAARAVLVAQAVDLLAVAGDLGGLRVRVHRHVRQAVQLVDQHRVGRSCVVELDQRHVLDDAGQVDRRLDAGVAAADHRDALALEQRAVAVRAVGHALVPVLLLAGHVDVAPARAGGQHHGAALQRRRRWPACTVDAAAGLGAPAPAPSTRWQVHDVDVVGAHVRFERGGELRALRSPAPR